MTSAILFYIPCFINKIVQKWFVRPLFGLTTGILLDVFVDVKHLYLTFWHQIINKIVQKWFVRPLFGLTTGILLDVFVDVKHLYLTFRHQMGNSKHL